MFTYLGGFPSRWPWLVCAIWLVLGGVLALLAPSWDARAQDDDIRFLPGRGAAGRGYELLGQPFPQDFFASRLLFVVERRDRKLNESDLLLVDGLVAELSRLRQDEPALQIKKITSHRDPFIGKRLLSDDG